MRTPQFKSNLICPVPPHVQEPPAAQRTDLLFPHAASFPATAGTAARHPCHNFPCIIQVFPIPRRINTATPKKDGPRTLAEAVPPMYLSLLLLFPLTLWFPVHRNNMIAVRAPGLCLHWLRGFRADIHNTLSAPWAFQSLHSCPPPRIQPRFLAAGALTWRLSHCLPPVKFLSTLSRQESLLPKYLCLSLPFYHKHVQTAAHAYKSPEPLSPHSGTYLCAIPDQIRIQIKP